MGYASRLGRAKVSSRDPQAAGVCDNCGFIYQLTELRWQMQWSGNKLVNLRQLVCRRCNDIPQTQLRAIVLPADPMPVLNPRVNNWQAAEGNFRTTSGQNTIDPETGIPIPGNVMRITENDDFRVTQTVGEPPGGLNTEPGTDPNAPGNNDPGLPYQFEAIPETGYLSPPWFGFVNWENLTGEPIGWINQQLNAINWSTPLE